jgi:hypothetical protein
VVKFPAVEHFPGRQPISVLGALLTGFDAVTRQLWLIVLPAGLDLALWLGPRLTTSQFWPFAAFDLLSGVDVQARLFARQLHVVGSQASENFNGLIWLRPPLLGVQGLMTGIEQGGPPGSASAQWQIADPVLLAAILALLSLTGIGLGGLYWSLVARQARDGRIDWTAALGRMPIVWRRMLGLGGLMLGLVFITRLPARWVWLALSPTGWLTGALVDALARTVLTWLLCFVTFSICGVVLYNQNVMEAVRASIRLGQANWRTVIGMLVAFVGIDFGMRVIWNLAPIDSWLWVAAIGGNAFVTAGLSMATMVFYMDRAPIPGSALMPQRT